MRENRALEVAAVVGGYVLLGLFVVGLLGLVGPVAREHCLVREGKGAASLQVESNWDINLGDLLDPARDTDDCVRNTPLREGLSAVGIWELGSPEHQVAEHVQ
jgi:hypothetical protein